MQMPPPEKIKKTLLSIMVFVGRGVKTCHVERESNLRILQCLSAKQPFFNPLTVDTNLCPENKPASK